MPYYVGVFQRRDARGNPTLAQFEKMNSKVVIFALAICLFVTASGGKSVFFFLIYYTTHKTVHFSRSQLNMRIFVLIT